MNLNNDMITRQFTKYNDNKQPPSPQKLDKTIANADKGEEKRKNKKRKKEVVRIEETKTMK